LSPTASRDAWERPSRAHVFSNTDAGEDILVDRRVKYAVNVGAGWPRSVAGNLVGTGKAIAAEALFYRLNLDAIGG
jgi:hypothetical protein